MADERIIRIKIETKATGGAYQTSESTGEEDSNVGKQVNQFFKVLTDPVGALTSLSTQFIGVLGSRILSETIDTLEDAVTYSFTRRWELKESYVNENNYATGMNVYKKSKSILANIGSWVGTGAMMAGGAGAVAGLAVGAVSSVTKEAMSYQKQSDSLTRQLNETELQTQYSARRLGLYDDNRGTEN